MSISRILNALEYIDDDLVSGAIAYTGKAKKHNWLKWGAMAACLCLVVAGAFCISIAFTPSQMIDRFRDGIQYEIGSIYDLPAEYDGKILAQNLNLSETATIEFYYKEGGDATNTDDWYSLLISDFQSDRELLVYCMFGVDDWKWSKDATKTTTINGVDVQITRSENSLVYEYRYYAIFEYDDIVYDIRVKSNDSDYIYDVLNQLLKK